MLPERIKRIEPCPCGSGLRLKDCCLSEDIAEIKNRVVKELLFPARIEWAINYIEYKTLDNKRIVEEQRRYAQSIGTALTCREKCSMCCIEFIGARLEECDAIAIYLYLYPELMNKFLINYRGWFDTITSGDNILEKTSKAYQIAFETRRSGDKEAFQNLALEYAKRFAYCPFLEDDKCNIYPLRPYTCSTYSVVSDKKYCDPGLQPKEYLKKKKIKAKQNPLFADTQYFTDLKGGFIFRPLQQAVYELIKYGYPC